MRRQHFADLPITSKLRRLQALTVGMALVFTLLVSSFTEFWKERGQIVADIKTTGNMIGFNAAAALLFNDSRSATDILAALRSKPNIIAAELYTSEGVQFADYVGERFADFITKNHFSTVPGTLVEAQSQLQENRFELLTHTEVQPVYQNGEAAGYLYMVVDLRPMWWGLFYNWGQISLVTLAAFLLSSFYGRRLATLISAPVIRLSQLAQQVSREKNYTVRAEGEGQDEIGQLVKSFNQMIGQIHERDEQLERQRGQLEHEVEIRTADLRHSVEEAHAANLAKSQFLATMSHEIRTPMNGVLGMTELLLSTELTETQRQYTETVFSSADALLTLINDILDFSKIEAGKLELEEIDFNLPELIDHLTGLFFDRAHSKNIELSCTLETNVPHSVRGDPYRLRQILTNLLSNAVKFTDVGSVRLHVSKLENEHYGLGDSFYLNFRISDTGIGIKPDAMAKLFKSFSQADGSTTRKYGGSGLGLAISKELTELMGGTINVESKVGAYTAFILHLPLRKALAAVPSQTLQKTDLLGKRALIVEDNPTNAKILTNYLLNLGMNSRLAETGMRALEILDQSVRLGQSYDFALVDMKMLGMNGAELCQQIRNDSRFAKMRIVIITSSAYDDELDSFRISGCDLYLHKPLRKRILQEALLKLIAENQTDTSLETGLQDAHILLAEDNPINQEIVKAILKVIGCHVEVAVNGYEALDIFKRGNIDLILMDCMMPEMDGYTATHEIRVLEQKSGEGPVPIVALTANAMEGDREKCLDAGMTDYLAKPISIEVLRDKVISLLKAKKTAIKRESDKLFSQQAYTDTGRFDPTPLNTLRKMGGDTLVANLLQMFQSSSAQLIEKLRVAMIEQDGEAVRQAAHSLKSAAANVGVLCLAEMARNLEHGARDGSLEFDKGLVENMNNEFQQVLPILLQQDLS
ncbi:hybrid sensor histidine kinase/response regulator [Methylovulum miyakonense]|uniref:hybrid sensor histidine kinase/response regulator n=1 Tax=Methylovulum miyakonense TaxID=645578 RepID=UPI000381FB4E|nr:hybrid sensor histidine kinase/response regulator [Methylovulum miyakonense]